MYISLPCIKKKKRKNLLRCIIVAKGDGAALGYAHGWYEARLRPVCVCVCVCVCMYIHTHTHVHAHTHTHMYMHTHTHTDTQAMGMCGKEPGCVLCTYVSI
jgi:hypothetical protein